MGSLSDASGRRYRLASPVHPDERINDIARVVNSAMQGKINAVGDVTLTANAASTTLTDARIGPNSFIYFMPKTANAAAEIGAGGFYVSARTDGSATLTHANGASVDRSFAYLVIG
jgi:hypothetical protein